MKFFSTSRSWVSASTPGEGRTGLRGIQKFGGRGGNILEFISDDIDYR